MPKLRNPLLSFDAKRAFGKLLSITHRHGKPIVEKKPIPTDAKSPAQLFSRHMFTKCVDLWHTLSEAEKQTWESAARPKHMTGYAWYISQCLKPNPGIYLPLQGGTMSGDIVMDKNKILKLPIPTDDQEAASKKYHDDNKYTDGETDARIALHAAVAAAHHAKTVLFATLTDRWTLAQAHRGALDKIMVFQGPGADPIEEAKGATLTVAETEVFAGASPNPIAWTDLDLSAVVGSNAALVLLRFYNPSTTKAASFRKNGDTDETWIAGPESSGCAHADVRDAQYCYFWIAADDGGIIEWKYEGAGVANVTIDIIGFIK